MAVGFHGSIVLACQDNPIHVKQRAQCRGNTASVGIATLSPRVGPLVSWVAPTLGAIRLGNGI
jgi:hypothetical protein